MTGTVTESYLLAPCESGLHHAPYSIHKISIAPLDQDMQCDMAMWGLLFQFQVAAGMMSPLGFAFATHGEGKGNGWKTGMLTICVWRHSFSYTTLGPLSPASVKSSSLLKTVSSPLKAVVSVSTYSSSRSFDEPGEFVVNCFLTMLILLTFVSSCV